MKNNSVEIELARDFECYPDGITLTEFKKGKQSVSERVAKLAADCGAVKAQAKNAKKTDQ